MIEKLTLRRAIEFAMATERKGAAFYDRLAGQHAGNPELAELFSALARDEEVHELQFQGLLKNLPAEERGALPPEEQEYLTALASAEIFYGDNEVLDPASGITSRADALERALSLEKATLLYYGAIRTVLGPSEVLDSVIHTERSHLVRVMKYMFTGAKMRGLLED